MIFVTFILNVEINARLKTKSHVILLKKSYQKVFKRK